MSAYADNFRFRVLQDALAEATVTYWQRRADQYRAALPQPGDHLGTDISTQDREARRRRILTAIEACEMRARYARQYGLGRAEQYDVEQALREVA